MLQTLKCVPLLSGKITLMHVSSILCLVYFHFCLTIHPDEQTHTHTYTYTTHIRTKVMMSAKRIWNAHEWWGRMCILKIYFYSKFNKIYINLSWVQPTRKLMLASVFILWIYVNNATLCTTLHSLECIVSAFIYLYSVYTSYCSYIKLPINCPMLIWKFFTNLSKFLKRCRVTHNICVTLKLCMPHHVKMCWE